MRLLPTKLAGNEISALLNAETIERVLFCEISHGEEKEYSVKIQLKADNNPLTYYENTNKDAAAKEHHILVKWLTLPKPGSEYQRLAYNDFNLYRANQKKQ